MGGVQTVLQIKGAKYLFTILQTNSGSTDCESVESSDSEGYNASSEEEPDDCEDAKVQKGKHQQKG